jgi:hypothetical protein
VSVGTLAGDQAPANDSAAWRKLWAECDPQATACLGGPWRQRLLKVSIAVPAPKAWDRGQRWHLCEVTTIGGMSSAPTPVRTSLKSRFAGLLTEMDNCVADDHGSRHPTRCDAPHSLEFVVMIDRSDVPYVDEDSLTISTFGLCYYTFNRFLDTSGVRQKAPFVVVPSESAWHAGDHNLACYLDIVPTVLSKSLRKAGE